MNVVQLLRESSDNQGTFGVLKTPTKTFYTIELPWKENRNNISCIPEGIYKVIWSLSPRLKKYTYEILGVPNRAGIRIHGGNLAGDESKGFISHSLGCPLLGKRKGFIKGQKAVLLSQQAVREFVNIMDKQSFILEIKNV